MSINLKVQISRSLSRAAALSRSSRLNKRVDHLLFRRATLRRKAARLLAKRGDTDSALAKFEEAVTIYPFNSAYLVEYGRLAVRNKQWQTAKEAVDRALALDAKPGSYVLRARALVGLGRYAEAVEDCLRAVALEPDRGDWWLALATTRLQWSSAGCAMTTSHGALPELTRTQEAIDDLRRALELDCTHTAPWVKVGRLLARSGRSSEAMEAYRRALALDDRHVQAHARLGVLLERAGKTFGAIDAFRAALALDDGQAKLHARLGRLLAKRREIEAAVDHLGRAIELDPGHPDWHADLNELRELVASGEAVGTLPDQKDARWYDTVYQHSNQYRVRYSDSIYWSAWQRILEYLAGFGRPAIIDIGCGPGQLASAIRDRGLASAYLGIDFSAVAIEMARSNAPEFIFVVGDALDAPEVEQFAYDVVICTEVLEHIERDWDVICRWRPGARVLATVPSFDSASHVRHFSSIDDVRARYGELIDNLSVEQIALGRASNLYLMCGIVAERA